MAQTGMFRIIRSQFARDWDSVASAAKETLDMGTRHSFGMPIQMSRFHLSYCRAVRGEGNSDVLNEMRAILQTRRTTNYYPLYLGLMAEAQAKCGDHGGALQTITEARSIVKSTGERLVEPELLRSHGILLRQVNSAQAESLLRAALSEARRQRARGWELRAAVSLAELLSETDRKSQALDLLRPVEAAFNQCTVTVDLRAARDLLRALAC